MQSNTIASPPATQQPRQYKPPQQRMPKKAGRNIEAISLNILAEPVMKEMKSSEVKGVRRLESRETVGAPVFLKLGQPLSSNPIRDMLRGPSGRPRGWEAAPESKVVKHRFLLSLSFKRRKHPLYNLKLASHS